MLQILADLGVRSPSLLTIWRTVNRSIAEDWRSQLATAAFAHVTADGALSIVMYDVTALYFEAENEDALRKVGMSKERRVDPQIRVGLLVDPTGFPLEVHAFAGNRGETTTLLPVLNGFRERHGRADVVVVADAGMLSAANLNALEETGFEVIVGSRTGSAPRDLADHYERVGNFFADGATVEVAREMGTGEAKRTRRVVWHYSRAREHRDNIALNKQIERAQDIAEGRRPPKKDWFVSLGTRPGVNWDAIKRIITALRPVQDVMIGIRGQHVMAETPLKGDAADIVAKLRESAGH